MPTYTGLTHKTTTLDYIVVKQKKLSECWIHSHSKDVLFFFPDFFQIGSGYDQLC